MPDEPTTPQAAPETPEPETQTIEQDLAAAAQAPPSEPEPEVSGGESEIPETPAAAPETDALLEFVATIPGGDALAKKYKTGYDLLQAAVNAQQLIGRRDADAELGRMIRERPAEAAAFIQQYTGRTQPQQQQQAPTATEVPEYRPEWQYMVEQDPETGLLRPKKGAPADIPNKLSRAAEYMQQQLARFAFNPQEALKPIIEPMVQQITGQVQQMIGAQLSGGKEREAVKQWADQNASWLFINGDPAAGDTAAGRAVAGYIQAAMRDGITDPVKAFHRGIRDYNADAALAMRAKPAGQAARAKPNVAAPQRQTPDDDQLAQTMDLQQHLLLKMREAAGKRKQ